MIRHMRKRKCKHCKTFFDPDPRNVGRQHYCAKPLCRQASKSGQSEALAAQPENQRLLLRLCPCGTGAAVAPPPSWVWATQGLSGL